MNNQLFRFCVLALLTTICSRAVASCPSSRQVNGLSPIINIGNARSIDAHMIYFGARGAGEKISQALEICNAGNAKREIDTFSFGENTLAFWAGPAQKKNATTRIILMPGQMAEIDFLTVVAQLDAVPAITVSEHGKIIEAIFLSYIVDDMPSPVSFETTIKDIRSGWIDKMNNPPYQICIGNPPPNYHPSTRIPPKLEMLHAHSSNGDSHPRSCAKVDGYATCTPATSGDNVCYDVAVEGHAKYQTYPLGPGDERDFVWFDLHLVGWYDFQEDAPQWIELIRKNTKQRPYGNSPKP